MGIKISAIHRDDFKVKAIMLLISAPKKDEPLNDIAHPPAAGLHNQAIGCLIKSLASRGSGDEETRTRRHYGPLHLS